MKNFEVLKEMLLKDFANMVFHIVKYDCKSEEEFEAILNREVSSELESKLKEALQKIQCSGLN